MVKSPPAKEGDVRVAGSISGSRSSPGEGNDNLLQYSSLGKPMDREACPGCSPWVAKSRTRLKRQSMNTHTHTNTHLLSERISSCPGVQGSPMPSVLGERVTSLDVGTSSLSVPRRPVFPGHVCRKEQLRRLGTGGASCSARQVWTEGCGFLPGLRGTPSLTPGPLSSPCTEDTASF